MLVIALNVFLSIIGLYLVHTGLIIIYAYMVKPAAKMSFETHIKALWIFWKFSLITARWNPVVAIYNDVKAIINSSNDQFNPEFEKQSNGISKLIGEHPVNIVTGFLSKVKMSQHLQAYVEPLWIIPALFPLDEDDLARDLCPQELTHEQWKEAAALYMESVAEAEILLEQRLNRLIGAKLLRTNKNAPDTVVVFECYRQLNIWATLPENYMLTRKYRFIEPGDD